LFVIHRLEFVYRKSNSVRKEWSSTLWKNLYQQTFTSSTC